MKQDRSSDSWRYCVVVVIIILLGVFSIYSCGGDSDDPPEAKQEKKADVSSKDTEKNKTSVTDKKAPEKKEKKLTPEEVSYTRFVEAVADELKKDPAFKDSIELAALKKRVSLHDSILNGLTNNFEMTFKFIRPDVFMMGSPGDEPGRESDEIRHQVTLTRAFMMQTTEVTQGQWRAVLNEAASKRISTEGLSLAPSYFKRCGDDCPVESVSWVEITTWIGILNKLGDGTYSLPSEAQWEYAARAGSKLGFASGEITETDYTTIDPVLDIMGWYFGNADGKTHAVAGKKPNVWGLYDMHGNVWEWCVDWYGDYPRGNATDPVGPDQGIYRVLRGGGWVDSAAECRSANRFRGDPGTRGSGVGFRLIRIPMLKGRL